MDSDLAIVERKNKEQKKLKLINVILVMSLIFILAILAFVLLTIRLQPPSPTPSVKVLDRSLYEGKYALKVPTEITVGQLFTYEARGNKLVDNTPEVRLQTVCTNDGVQTIQTTATFTSIGVAKGAFHIKRSTTVTPSTKNVASDNCELQSISTFTFYKIDQNGNESSFEVIDTATSNKFKLIIPEGSNETSSTNTVTNNVAVVPSSPTPNQPRVVPDNTPSPDPVPTPEVVNPDPQPAVTCALGLPVQNVFVLGGLLCR